MQKSIIISADQYQILQKIFFTQTELLLNVIPNENDNVRKQLGDDLTIAFDKHSSTATVTNHNPDNHVASTLFNLHEIVLNLASK